MKGKKRWILLALALLLIGLILWAAWGNNTPVLTDYTVTEETLPPDFEGFKIAQISDLHNASLGQNNKKVLALLRQGDPDIIAITGDLIDSRNTNIERALSFVEEALKIAPCYYVPGNHEARVSSYNILREGLIRMGVTVLDNKGILLESGSSSIFLAGVNDPAFETDYLGGDSAGVLTRNLPQPPQEDSYTILLSHRPELFSSYVEADMDLVLTGHAHGGQFRLPFLGGLFAPNQGLFPKYTEGVYSEGSTDMVVSRGLGNSLFPLRINNRPEVVMITLRCEKS